jgi:porin
LDSAWRAGIRLGTSIPPQSLAREIGAGTPTAIGFSEFDLTLAELYHEQEIVKDRFAVRIGKMVPFGVYDFFYFKNPKTDFLNANFALNPTVAWPQFGLGAVTEVRPIEQLYIVVGIHDANGSPTRAGFDTFFEDREYFVIGDVGWDPGYLIGEKRNPMAPDIHATFWHTDARKKAGRPEGWGVSLIAQKAFGNIVPFARYGYSDGGAALLKHLVMAGVNWMQAFNYRQDMVGFAVSYGKPSAAGLRDQYTAELYYRSQVTRRLALSPSVQLIVNPSANPQHDVLGVFGFRVRVDF